MRVHVILLFCAYVSGQEPGPPPPLPAANEALVEQYKLALEAVFGVGIRLQAFLEGEERENFLVSPISATVILGQLILGAEGEFRKQLVELLALPKGHLYENENYYEKKKNVTFQLPYSTLHLQLASLVKKLEAANDTKKHFTLKQKSALFIDHSVKLNKTFKMNLQNFYNTKIKMFDFQNKQTEALSWINTWVSNNTRGLITSILPEPPSPTTLSIFANYIYFKADWELPFSHELNRDGLFSVTTTETIPVTYMLNFLEQIPYFESPEFRLISIPYVDQELGMYLILPNNDNPHKYDIKTFAQNLKSRQILDSLNQTRRKDVVVKIPKMSLRYSFSLLNQLKKYRAFKKTNIKINSTNVVDKLDDRVDAFNNFTKVDEKDVFLTGAALGAGLRVDDMIQQVAITVNEKGTEAAAVTAATIDYMGGSKNFVVDRPFIFFIRHEASGATLFWGTVSKPK
ncbi:leukocyte elastase inhibitor-like [Tribolium madens]|uniref:leukocyte elastase inhibitor-like n=1 Tax=Tribolium madens TaxID=41895 RepID=UPI001CF72361|nr:leukocyte elastase inhibitor-like [Tribolium madens]